ncbi:MAG: hypothetical protein FD174_1316 [Geobacteraceae bacterium]|nr:MAG: hypothetical protein FD174_1316 [Geobacteraceae bacterium]
MMEEAKHSEKDIAAQIIAGRTSGVAVEEKLSTSQRVLARVTDGIYRQPSSALRELIANAYDADATQVHIHTDAPRFDKIIVRDNGLGLKAEVLAHVIKNIGGSAKRTRDGIELGVTDSHDPLRSPGGRELIGKIGIGLFSVAQLTNHFQIITKVKGEKFRTVADIILHTYSEDHLAESEEKHEFQTGSVVIWSASAEDIEAQGTEIVLIDIKRSAKEILQSRELWLAVSANMQRAAEGEPPELDIEPPSYHIGGYAYTNGDHVEIPRKLPWDDSDKPSEKFHKLVDAMMNELGGRTKPQLKMVFDNYLQTVWSLSLAAPLDYIDGHPFSITGKDAMEVFLLSNETNGKAVPLLLKDSQTVSSAAGLTTENMKNSTPFAINIDGVQLCRPVKYKGLPESGHALKNPLLMIGKCYPDLSSVREEFRGGDLEFEAYLFWTPRVVPLDHAGVLIRIHEASGTLFEETFMKYQVSELTRLKQITAEIFVSKGLDGALNIDRESFNYAHPHYQIIQKWLHGALRQLATTQKRLAKQVRDHERETLVEVHKTVLQNAVEEEWVRIRGDEERPPDVQFVVKGDFGRVKGNTGLVFERERIFPAKTGAVRKTSTSAADEKKFEEQVRAVAAVLSAYGVFDEMTQEKQQELLRAIARIFAVEAA